MKAFFPMIQIVLALVGIFALGIWVGRLTAPQSVPVEELSIDQSTTQDPSIHLRASRNAFRRYDSILEFSAAQKEQLKPLFQQIGLQMAVLEKRSKARHFALEEFHQKITPLLTEDQAKKLDPILEKSEERKESE